MPCGDEHVRTDDVLIIHAASPIPYLEPAKFRPPVLLVGEERFVLLSVAGTPKKPVYTLRLERPSLYEPAGRQIDYDPNRHLERRQEAARTAVGFLLWIPLIPLMPILGLLPQAAKDKLQHLGIDPGRATRLSIGIEWMLLGLLVIAYLMSGGFFTPAGALLGPLTLFVAADITFRVASDYDNKQPGFFGLAPEIVRWVRGSFAATRDDPTAGLLDERRRVHAELEAVRAADRAAQAVKDEELRRKHEAFEEEQARLSAPASLKPPVD